MAGETEKQQQLLKTDWGDNGKGLVGIYIYVVTNVLNLSKKNMREIYV